MSIEYKSAIIYGCKVEQNLWHELWNYCDNHWEEEDDEIPEDWEDFFIETNQWGTASEYFFGIIVSEIDCHDAARRIVPWINNLSYDVKKDVECFYRFLTPFITEDPTFDFWQTMIVC